MITGVGVGGAAAGAVEGAVLVGAMAAGAVVVGAAVVGAAGALLPSGGAGSISGGSRLRGTPGSSGKISPCGPIMRC